ncbi:histonelysine Nmethyltransferase SETMARlike [Trichonephila clavipes]|nr:histonelysine Nmethyltransferase SETMARlike [Trichonephila clavipes]
MVKTDSSDHSRNFGEFLRRAVRRNESCQSLRQFGLLHDRWRHYLSPPPQFRHGTGGKGNFLQPPSPVVSAVTACKTFGPTDLMITYSEGIFDVKNTPRTGRPVIKNVDKITEIIEVDRHVSSRSITQELKIDHKTVLSHLRKVGFKKKFHVWVPHQKT